MVFSKDLFCIETILCYENDIKKGLNGEKIDFTMAKAEFLTLSNIKYDGIKIEKIRNERIMRVKYELSKSDTFFWKELF